MMVAWYVLPPSSIPRIREKKNPAKDRRNRRDHAEKLITNAKQNVCIGETTSQCAISSQSAVNLFLNMRAGKKTTWR
jgi:hypothetical protein